MRNRLVEILTSCRAVLTRGWRRRGVIDNASGGPRRRGGDHGPPVDHLPVDLDPRWKRTVASLLTATDARDTATSCRSSGWIRSRPLAPMTCSAGRPGSASPHGCRTKPSPSHRPPRWRQEAGRGDQPLGRPLPSPAPSGHGRHTNGPSEGRFRRLWVFCVGDARSIPGGSLPSAAPSRLRCSTGNTGTAAIADDSGKPLTNALSDGTVTCNDVQSGDLHGVGRTGSRRG